MSGHCQNLRKHPLPSIDELRSRFWYSKGTGRVFSMRGYYSQRRQVGSLKRNGYVVVSLQSSPSVHVLLHRLAFALIEGEWPDVVHHINGDRADNRWSNLSNGSQRDNLRAENRNRKFPFGITPCGRGFVLGFTIDGVIRNVHFTLWWDAFVFRRYLDRGFARYGEAFEPVIPPKSKRLF